MKMEIIKNAAFEKTAAMKNLPAYGGEGMTEDDRRYLKREKFGRRSSSLLKIVCPAIYAVITVFSLILFFELISAGTEEQLGVAAIFFLIAHIGIGGTANLAAAVFSLAGLMRSVKHYRAGCCAKGEIVYYAVFIVLPLITWAGIIVASRLIL